MKSKEEFLIKIDAFISNSIRKIGEVIILKETTSSSTSTSTTSFNASSSTFYSCENSKETSHLSPNEDVMPKDPETEKDKTSNIYHTHPAIIPTKVIDTYVSNDNSSFPVCSASVIIPPIPPLPINKAIAPPVIPNPLQTLSIRQLPLPLLRCPVDALILVLNKLSSDNIKIRNTTTALSVT